MKRKIFLVLVVTALLLLGGTVGVFAGDGGGNPFKKETTTAGGYTTWDSDMINIEAVSETGDGVYVAVLDTGLAPNWRDYFPKERIATHLGTGFDQSVTFKARTDDPCGLEVEVGRLRQTTWVGSVGTTHGTHVASTIIGYFYRANADLASGFNLPPIMVRGIAPDVTIIPVKVLADYQIPAMPHCEDPGPIPAQNAVFGTDAMVAAGIDYATDLAIAGYAPMIVSMSLGGPDQSTVIEAAIDRAIAEGVIVVAAAGNAGTGGMDWPGAYPEVISAGASGWTGEWLNPDSNLPFYRMWWLQDEDLITNPVNDPDPTDPTAVSEVYVTDWSSRELAGQELDVLAPGSWVRGPFPGTPGYSHLPWWSKGIGDVAGWNPGNFYYAGGTSMSTPHVSAVAALMLEKNSTLTQQQVETILKSTALLIPPGSATVFDLYPAPSFYTYSWGADATGAGLIQADTALAATP